jgi:1,4-alpha-glucan branching enzyme
MGAMIHERGTAFRVWAPNAQRVAVVGTFNDWAPDAHPLETEGNGYWYADVPEARVGHEYRFLIAQGDKTLSRVDPYARQVTNSIGNGIICDAQFDWEGDTYQLPPWNELVIYELHIGTFNDLPGGMPGTFRDAIARLPHLKQLGVNVVQVMPIAEFAGDYSWGYNPAHVFAVESSYGGPQGFKEFVKAAHRLGLGVILDVVYNHFGPSDLNLWQFDGWSENGLGGIYFYNDWRSETPWGNTRPDYGRGEVRQFIRDNALMWLEEYHVDGLRFDMTLFIRTVRPGADLPEGWSLTQWLNSEIHARFPGRITIAEDLQHNEWLTKDVDGGGAGFGAQWDSNFVHPIRAAVISADDRQRSMDAVRDAVCFSYNGDPFERVIYSESHDEVANGKARVPSEIDPQHPHNYYAQKRSTLAAGLVFTAPGIPMLFQGQEFLEGGWFRDTVPVDWHLREDFQGIVLLYRDLIALRRNQHGHSRGLCGRGIRVLHVNDAQDFLAFHRWDRSGAGDDVVVVVNFSAQPRGGYVIGFPRAGTWRLRLNSAWRGYSAVFSNHPSTDVEAVPGAYDGFEHHAQVSIAPYTLLIYSQDPDEVHA